MSNYYLAHHGILGQKWGKKNGPPYPLDYKKLSEEERAKAKESAIRRGDVKEAQFNKEYFTDQEVRQVMERFDLNQKLSKVADPAKQSNFEKIENFVNKADRTAKMIDKGTDVWNTVAKISNGLGLLKPNELPVIDKRDPWNKPKEKEKTTKKTEFYDIENGKATRTKWVETDSDGNSKTFNVINKNKDNSDKLDKIYGTSNDTETSKSDNTKVSSTENSNKDQTKTKTDNSKSNWALYNNSYKEMQWDDPNASNEINDLKKIENWRIISDWKFGRDSDQYLGDFPDAGKKYTEYLLNKNISDLDNYFNNKK